MRTILNILLIATLFGCSESERSGFDQKIGKYEIHGFNSGVTIELKPESKFVYERSLWSCFGGGDIQRIAGRYTINHDRLLLDPKYIVSISYFGFDQNNFKRDSLEYYQSDSTYLPHEFQIATWDSLTYLLSEENYSPWGFPEDENDYERMSNYYNSGYEPGQSGSYFVKRPDGHLPTADLDISKFPTKYQNRFLNEPIVGEILNVEKIEMIGDSGKVKFANQYKLNRGRQDGVMEKMDFYGDDGCCIIRITAVDEKKSFGRIYLCYDYQADCGKGGRVTTYLEREKGVFKNHSLTRTKSHAGTLDD